VGDEPSAAGSQLAATERHRPGQQVAGLFRRSPHNPVLNPADWPYPVNTVFNPAAAQVDGQTVLVCRVEDRRGISHLTVARSLDGATGWEISPTPLISAGDLGEASRWGVEDPRVVWLEDQAAWVLTFTAYGPAGPAVAMARTTDFVEVELLGVVMPPPDKNASLLPYRIDGQYVMFHRPTIQDMQRSDVWLSRSPDLRSWSEPTLVLPARPGPWWDNVRIGMGPPPVLTTHGWLAVYHGIKSVAGGLVYRAGLALLDAERPERVLRRTDEWVFSPVEPYERTGDAPNVVFPTGLVHDVEQDRLRLYYGAADTCVGLASASYSEVVDFLLTCPAPEPSGA